MTAPPHEKLLLPGLGDAVEAELVSWEVAVGDLFESGQTVALVESDKATLEVPAPAAGRVLALKVSVGDEVGEGCFLMEYEALAGAEAAAVAAVDTAPASPSASPLSAIPPPSAPLMPSVPVPVGISGAGSTVYAGPAVRRLARKLSVPLERVRGTGTRGRVQLEDLYAWVRAGLQAGAGAGLPRTEWPNLEDFGPVQRRALTRLQRTAAQRLHAGWVNIPLVTQHDDAEVDELEALRLTLKPEAKQRGVKVTPLAFILQATIRTLQQYPLFRSALEPSGKSLVQRDSYHIGIAVDTERGLLVPVVRDADARDLYEIAAECAALAERARRGKLKPADMAGAVFTLSSLGHLGGTAFTPLINPPEVAILGISAMQPYPRLLEGKKGYSVERGLKLPLSLSYDHRVINGVQAVRFTRTLADHLAQPQTLIAAVAR